MIPLQWHFSDILMISVDLGPEWTNREQRRYANVLFFCQITAKERQLAERYYLKRYASDFTTSKSSSEAASTQFHQTHPRYSALLEGAVTTTKECVPNIRNWPFFFNLVHGFPMEVGAQVQGSTSGVSTSAMKDGLIRIQYADNHILF